MSTESSEAMRKAAEDFFRLLYVEHDFVDAMRSHVSQLSAPSVNIAAGSDVFGPSSVIYIRGIGQYDTNPAYDPGVGVYIDDVYYGILLGSNIELMDLDRVEILRGPQGTTSGKNSIGGSVKRLLSTISRRSRPNGSFRVGSSTRYHLVATWAR